MSPKCCFSFTASGSRWHRSAFVKSGLRPTTTDLGDGTVMHCWVPRTRSDSKPDLLLIHGFGASAVWQWARLVRRTAPHFNVYVPDLVFFGGSVTTRPDRSEAFQARCVMRVMEANSVRRVRVVGLSYGGFVGYSMAAQFKEAVERVVICCAGVSMSEEDFKVGMFKVAEVEEAARILVPQTPEKLRELMGYTFYRPPRCLPSCILEDFIQAMCTEYVEQKRDLIKASAQDHRLCDIPKITQPTLIVWGDQDQVFPLDLAHRLKRHLGGNAELVVIKKAGHTFFIENFKEFYRHLKPFLFCPSNTPGGGHQSTVGEKENSS